MLSPSSSHVHRDDNACEELQIKPASRNPQVRNYIHRRFLGGGNNFSNYRRSKSLLQDMIFAIPAGYGSGMVCGRNYLSSSVPEGTADKIEVLNEMVGDTAMEAPSVVNEVAVAAADSSASVPTLHYLIDYVHCFTRFDCWRQLGKKCRIRYGVSPLTPWKGPLISAPIFLSFFLAVTNMTEKVPSFKEGGILWFIDLTTPNSLYVFPILTALTFWIMVECNAQEGMEGNPSAGIIKNVCRVFAILTVPLTASFPKAIFCYWITSNLFSLVYGLVMKNSEVKKYFGIPIVPVTPPLTDQKPDL
ncbi:hypothetical protein C2S52_022242 [Perilla frutescens var. hirtella]|nr:hypothetical protein C2S52_022242 [Perilla frutescens var. hirtella]